MTRAEKILVLTTFLLLYFLTTTRNATSNGMQNLKSYEIVRGGKNLRTEKRTEILKPKDIRTIFKL